jgi:hypothetical protein
MNTTAQVANSHDIHSLTERMVRRWKQHVKYDKASSESRTDSHLIGIQRRDLKHLFRKKHVFFDMMIAIEAAHEKRTKTPIFLSRSI